MGTAPLIGYGGTDRSPFCGPTSIVGHIPPPLSIVDILSYDSYQGRARAWHSAQAKGIYLKRESRPIVETSRRIGGWFDHTASLHRFEGGIQERHNPLRWLRLGGSAH